VARIEAHIAAHPDDGRAYEVVAPVYLRMGRYDDAVSARQQALKLLGPTPERYVRYAEALSYAADGVVSPEAEFQIDRALKLDPKFMEARYFLGLAAAQHDEKEEARKIWSEMMAELPEGSKVREAVAERIALLDAPDSAAPQDKPTGDAGPPSAAASNSAAAPAAPVADAQQQMINSMVARLAQRLATKGGDAEEWMRLIRAYKVLNEADKAQGALAEARKALKEDAEAQTKLAALAQELGLRTP